jgi:hypothetical protein
LLTHLEPGLGPEAAGVAAAAVVAVVVAAVVVGAVWPEPMFWF